MPVMGMRVHLSERIELMSEIRAIGFVVPALDPRKAGVNAAGGVGDKVSDRLLWELVLQELRKARVIASVELPNWNSMQWVLWRARVGLKGTDCCKSARGQTIN